MASCPSCSKEIEQENTAFCPHCGVTLGARTCPSCSGEIREPGAAFCPHCAAALNPEPADSPAAETTAKPSEKGPTSPPRKRSFKATVGWGSLGCFGVLLGASIIMIVAAESQWIGWAAGALAVLWVVGAVVGRLKPDLPKPVTLLTRVTAKHPLITIIGSVDTRHRLAHGPRRVLRRAGGA